ncbi:MAG: hypothetical protein US92_C0010G0011 [Candidatus Peregrinibacteria bacterium GW2011_GWA2_38_36]|nr:MAG: hypothetical protein US92_C0010G0011 [Candidatus Peregrinibacteria bacterium GW2011_GWA2_38_36]
MMLRSNLEKSKELQNLNYTGSQEEKREIQTTLSQIAQLAAKVDGQISDLKKPETPKSQNFSTRPVESSEKNNEKPEWNEKVILTFDDSLKNSLDIARHLEQKGITNYRFYGEAATAIRSEVLRDMGIFKNRDSRKLTPGKWLTEYVDKKRGSMSRENYMREYMIKGSESEGTNYLAKGEEIRKMYQSLYPNNWLIKIEETFGYHAAMLHPSPIDTKNHIQWWKPDQIAEDIETYETFIRAWLNIPQFQVRHLRTPGGGGFGFDTTRRDETNARKLTDTVKKIRPNATWEMWDVDSHDSDKTVKYVNYAETARLTIATINDPFDKKFTPQNKAIVLMHSNHYEQKDLGKIDTMTREIKDAYNANKTESNEHRLAQKQAIVKVENAWVRYYPGTESFAKVIAKLEKGTTVFVKRRVNGSDGWLEIESGSPKIETGYMHESQLKSAKDTEQDSLTTAPIATPPSIETIRDMIQEIPEKYRHYFTSEDRKFISSTISNFANNIDRSKDQYLIAVDRGNKQFAALLFFKASTNTFEIVGNFGTKVSTGKEDVSSRSWATPLGLYDLKPYTDKRERMGKPEWRSDGKGGGFGPKGSRVFHLGHVDVHSPYPDGKGGRAKASIAMHKTSRGALSLLGKRAASHGCIRASDEFIDLLDKQRLTDSSHGRYIVVGDSDNDNRPKYAGDFENIDK